MQSKQLATIAAVIVGLLFIAIGVIYLITPASGLPGFLPGHEVGVATPHTKHGLLSFALAICCFVAARFLWGPSGETRVN